MNIKIQVLRYCDRSDAYLDDPRDLDTATYRSHVERLKIRDMFNNGFNQHHDYKKGKCEIR